MSIFLKSNFLKNADDARHSLKSLLTYFFYLFHIDYESKLEWQTRRTTNKQNLNLSCSISY